MVTTFTAPPLIGGARHGYITSVCVGTKLGAHVLLNYTAEKGGETRQINQPQQTSHCWHSG